MAEIQLTRGMVALVDDPDLALVSHFSWHAKPRKDGRRWYAQAYIPGSGHRGKQIMMHQLLMPGVAGIDHKNCDGLDNRRGNIRPATQAQNIANRGKYRGRSRFKGVTWDRVNLRWRATIKYEGRRLSLGRHADEVEAARAYDAAAIRLYGEYARPNLLEAEWARLFAWPVSVLLGGDEG